MAKGEIHIGTSGWSYRSWIGPFFPKALPASAQLKFYASRFHTTELNGVFYRTPTEDAVRRWAETTPDHFVFAWKASKFITHWKRLGPTSPNSLELMESRLRLLGDKAGPVLFQLPPQMQKNRERLASFVKLLRPKRPYAFEFRHPSWYDDDILDFLKDQGISLCVSDHHDAPSPHIASARHVYLRGHGPQGTYRDRYPDQTLKRWAKWLQALARKGHNTFVYFDNDQKSAAPLDALRLRQILERTSATERR